MKTVYCIICRKGYNIRGIHTHYYRTHASEEVRMKYPSGNNANYKVVSEKLRRRAEDRNKEKETIIRAEYERRKPLCKCGLALPFDKFKHNIKNCSRKCANSRGKMSEETRAKISASLTKEAKIFTCDHCGNRYSNRRKRKFCNPGCRKAVRQQSLPDNLYTYRIKCEFKFNVFDYPEEFDLELISKFGFYKPSNRGNNINGISRDHMLSVKYGYENNIDPVLIGHPANCRLMKHSENISKNSKSSITLDELTELIKTWDSKYMS